MILEITILAIMIPPIKEKQMKRFLVITISLYLIAGASLFCIVKSEPQNKIRNTEANDIIYTIRKEWPDVEGAVGMLQGYETDYLVTDAEGSILSVSIPGLETDYTYDFIHKDYSVDLVEEGQLQGRIIFINNEESDFKKKVVRWVLLLFAAFLGKDIWLILYLKRHVYEPVRRMNDFAGQIAKGNLEIPVGQADSSFYGDFSESFDMMREELLYAKKREQEADRQRRELIASISHDIKNPTASIQAIAEFQALTTESETLRQEFQTIVQKTSQISGMISNLQTSMLNDLERLTVNPEVTESVWIERALRQADIKKRIRGLAIPECLVMADRVRFLQVADNIICNSYKYADTEIEVRCSFDAGALCIHIRDFGQGVKKEEEIFLTQKYFRGQNAKGKEGSGMGMYIAEYLIKEMGGRLQCRSKEKEWFEVTVWLTCA